MPGGGSRGAALGGTGLGDDEDDDEHARPEYDDELLPASLQAAAAARRNSGRVRRDDIKGDEVDEDHGGGFFEILGSCSVFGVSGATDDDERCDGGGEGTQDALDRSMIPTPRSPHRPAGGCRVATPPPRVGSPLPPLPPAEPAATTAMCGDGELAPSPDAANLTDVAVVTSPYECENSTTVLPAMPSAVVEGVRGGSGSLCDDNSDGDAGGFSDCEGPDTSSPKRPADADAFTAPSS